METQSYKKHKASNPIGINYKKTGQGKQALVFVHGILGYWRNFYSISQTFKDSYTCVLYDQRGHGYSFHQEPYTVQELAKDLKELIAFLKLESVVLVGHSLGGYVSCYLAHQEPDLIKQLVIVDSCPSPKQKAAEEIVRILSSLPDHFKRREEARNFFNQSVKEGLFSENLSYFLMGSLEKKSEGPIRFLFDKTGLLKLISSVRQEDYSLILKELAQPVLFLRGGNSTHFLKSDLERTVKLNPLIKGLEIPDSGHWLHAEQAQKFIKAVKKFLSQSDSV